MKENNGIRMKLRWILMFVIALPLINVNGIIAKAETTKDINAENTEKSISSEEPIINKESLTLSATSGTVADEITVSAKIKDNTEISCIQISFGHIETNETTGYGEMHYNAETGLYTFNFRITVTTQNGHWYVNNIIVTNKYGEKYDYHFEPNDIGFIVQGATSDKESPEICKGSLAFDSISGSVGDKIKFTVKVTDNEEINYVGVIFKNIETSNDRGICPMEYNEETGLYEYYFEIKDNTPTGHWYVFCLLAQDKAGNDNICYFENYDPVFAVNDDNRDIHHWDNEIIIEQPTCTTTGLKQYKCALCLATKNEILPQNLENHDYKEEIIKKATCAEKGIKQITCNRCDYKKNEEIQTTEHDFDEWTIVKKPTVTEKGLEQRQCKNCNISEYRIIPILTGKWKSNSYGEWYEYSDGSYLTNCWSQIDGNWYHFGKYGYCEKGWINVNGTWYYMNGSGAMLTGWQYINGVWYYMNSSGAMLTGWQYINGAWYYMNGSGAMLTGWQYINRAWYYMNGSGSMLTGWQYIDGKWYYFYSGGNMAANTWIGNCYVNSSGAWI